MEGDPLPSLPLIPSLFLSFSSFPPQGWRRSGERLRLPSHFPFSVLPLMSPELAAQRREIDFLRGVVQTAVSGGASAASPYSSAAGYGPGLLASAGTAASAGNGAGRQRKARSGGVAVDSIDDDFTLHSEHGEHHHNGVGPQGRSGAISLDAIDDAFATKRSAGGRRGGGRSGGIALDSLDAAFGADSPSGGNGAPARHVAEARA